MQVGKLRNTEHSLHPVLEHRWFRNISIARETFNGREL